MEMPPKLEKRLQIFMLKPMLSEKITKLRER
jgi:hypothetical protein